MAAAGAAVKPDLYPIVTKPLSHPPFECAGSGLLYQTHSRASISDLRAWLFPKRKNSAPLSRLKAWWQAQLVLYGLGVPKNSEPIAALRARLEAAVLDGRCDTLPRKLVNLEARLNHAFLQENARRRRENFLQSGGTDEELLAMENPVLFLRQKFPNFAGSSIGKGSKEIDKDHVCVLKRLNNGARAAVHTLAPSLGLHTVSADAPVAGYGSRSRWLVVGRDREAVWSEMREINKQTAALREQERALHEQERAARHQEMEEQHEQYLLSKCNAAPKVPESSAMVGRRKGAMAANDDPYADVKGKWYIICEEIEKQWPGVKPLWLYLYRENDPCDDDDDDDGYGGSASEGSDADEDEGSDVDSDDYNRRHGPGRLMAKFDFREVQGLMKFSKESNYSSAEKMKKKRKRVKEVIGEKKLRFRWRGTEEGTWELLWDPYGYQKGWIKFHGSASAKLSGRITWQGRMAFSGIKLSDKVPAHARDDDWRSYR